MVIKISEVLLISVWFLVMSANTFADMTMRYNSSMIAVAFFALAIIMILVRAVKKIMIFYKKGESK